MRPSPGRTTASAPARRGLPAPRHSEWLRWTNSGSSIQTKGPRNAISANSTRAEAKKLPWMLVVASTRDLIRPKMGRLRRSWVTTLVNLCTGSLDADVRDIRYLADDGTFGVDLLGRGVCQHHLRAHLHGLHAQLDVFRMEQVVVRRPLEVLPAGEMEALVEVRSCADIRRVAYIADPGVAGVPPAGDLLRPVGGGVVRDDQLEIRVGLAENRPNRLVEVGIPILDGQTDADGWLLLGHRVLDTRLTGIDNIGRVTGSVEPGTGLTHPENCVPDRFRY